MNSHQQADVHNVICRIGSLEMIIAIMKTLAKVICRIGSLEKFVETSGNKQYVICRIGSLEIL